MKLTVVGCSPAWPNPGAAHSGYLLEHDGRRLLVECGPGVLARLRASEGWPRIDAIAITHFHLDHCGDLVPWLWGHSMGPARGAPAPELWIPPEGRRDLDALATSFDDVFTVHEYGDTFEAPGFEIEARRVPHYSQPTWALRVQAGKRVVAFSADSSPADALTETARDADLFLCEATLGDDEEDKAPRGHMSAREAAATALAASARRLLLVHRPVELPVSDGLELAHEGLEIEL